MTRQKSDVRERKQTDEPLAWEILNSSSNLIFLKDTEGRYLFVNRQFERTFRTRQERIKEGLNKSCQLRSRCRQ